jgi:tRNA threonylcarbamoyladenosine dehydratase
MADLAWLGRTTLLVGEEKVDKMQNAHVLVVGLGGVGSFAAEYIVRAGIGTITIVDGDTVDPSNRNRQLPALSSNHGVSKVKIMKERLLDINPDLILHAHELFMTPDVAEDLCTKTKYDYVVDCIDSLSPKLYLIAAAYNHNLNIVSSMGAGGKLDPTKIEIADICETHMCKFSLMVRKRLKFHNIISGIKTVFSSEPVIKESLMLTDGSNFKKSAYGTISYIPAAFGGMCASVVIRDIMELEIKEFQHIPKPRKRKSTKKKRINTDDNI